MEFNRIKTTQRNKNLSKGCLHPLTKTKKEIVKSKNRNEVVIKCEFPRG